MKTSVIVLLFAVLASVGIARAADQVIGRPVMKSAHELRAEGYLPRESDMSFVWSRSLNGVYEIVYRDGFKPADGTWFSAVWVSPTGQLEFDAGEITRVCQVKACKQTSGFSGRLGCAYSPKRVVAILGRNTPDVSRGTYIVIDIEKARWGEGSSFGVDTQLSGGTFAGIGPLHNTLMGSPEQIPYDKAELRFLAPEGTKSELEIVQGNDRLFLKLGDCGRY